HESAALIAVLSPASAGSEYVPRELSLADKFDPPVIPVLLQPREAGAERGRIGRLDFQLAGLQQVDFAHQSFEAGVQDLLRALRTEERAPRPARGPSPPAPAR